MMERKRYLIAVRPGMPSIPDMAARLAEIEGITALAVSAQRARVEATAEGIARLRNLLGDRYLIEETASRRPL
jgi:hypothetical protein